jgi:hypothetical protein
LLGADARVSNALFKLRALGKRRPPMAQSVECNVALLHQQERFEFLETHGPPPSATVVAVPPPLVVGGLLGCGLCFGFGVGDVGGDAEVVGVGLVALVPVVGGVDEEGPELNELPSPRKLNCRPFSVMYWRGGHNDSFGAGKSCCGRSRTA